MSRRMFWLGLAALTILVGVSLSSVLAAVPASGLLTPTLPPADQSYLPLVIRSSSPLPTATQVLPATATVAVTPTSPVPTEISTVTPTAESTATPSATATQTVGGHQLSLNMTEQLQWYDPAQLDANYDLVIVADYSYSMRFCWDTNQSCPTGSRRIDIATKVLTGFVDEMLTKRNLQQGGENRLAFVTFSQTATQRIPFITDTNAALAAWQAQIGTVAAPRNIPNFELPGNTNTASGLVGAASSLNDARTVDSHGKPVRLAVLLFTDGLANVFNDGGYVGVSNRSTQPPFYCGENPNDMDNPYVQATCPSDAEFPNINPKPLPPLKAMVKAADDTRAARPGITFYALVLGAQFGLTPVGMHLNQVAPDNYYMANNPAQLEGLVAAIEQELGEPCSDVVAAPRAAAGASVTIAFQGGATIGVFTADAQGQVVIPNLLPGTYTLSAQHLDVIAPADPVQIARDYTRMIIDGSSQPVSSTTFTMPDANHSFPAIKLVIDSPANAQCPN
jgi:hypothetical protein